MQTTTRSHLYILAVLDKAGLNPDDVTLVNTPPPDMTVALLTKGIDAFSGWDPWSIVAGKDVPDAVRCSARRIAWPGILKSTFDVNAHIEPKYILKVMKDHPELFSDLPPIPESVAIGPGFVFKP